MSQSRKKLAIVGDNKFLTHTHFIQKHIRDDAILKEAFASLPDAKAIQVELVDWKSDTNFLQYDAILVTSTWDLHRTPEKFIKWLDACESDGKKRLINDIDVLKLGMKKHAYMGLLLKKFGEGMPAEGCIIPTHFVNVEGKQNPKSFTQILASLKNKHPEIWSSDLVVKPNTSADGDNTFIVTHDESKAHNNPGTYKRFKEMDAIFEQMKANKDHNGVMIQPLIKSIEKHGEYQLIFVNGQFSHAIVKPPGFKNNRSSGRKPVPLEALPDNMIGFAYKVMEHLDQQFPGKITKARIDFFVGDTGPIVSEVELVEPNTNINRLESPEKQKAAARLASAVVTQMYRLEVLSRQTSSSSASSFFGSSNATTPPAAPDENKKSGSGPKPGKNKDATD